MARASSTSVFASSARNAPQRSFGLSDRALRLLREARLMLTLTAALFLLLLLASYDRADPGWSNAAATDTVHNLGGHLGAWVADLLLYLFGLSAYLWLALLAVLVLREFQQLRTDALAARGLPEPARQLVMTEYASIKSDHDTISALKHRMH